MSGALGSGSSDIRYESGGVTYHRHCVLPLVISYTRTGARFATGIGFCVLRYHKRDKGYDLLRALDSASYDITYETGGMICQGHWILRRYEFLRYWVLCLLISYTRHGVPLVTCIGSKSCDSTSETEVRIYYGHRVLFLMISYTRQRPHFQGHWVLPLMISHTRQGVRFVTDIEFCVL